MSATGGFGEGVVGHGLSRLRQFDANARQTLATLFRAPRPPGRRQPWPSRERLALGTVLACVAVLATMLLIDGWSVANVRRLPEAPVEALNRFTDFGWSGYFLWPLGLLMIALGACDSPALPRFTRGVLAAWGVRIGFLFTAIAAPSLFVAISKRLVGRARPLVEGNDVWAYHHFSWHVEYASLPSGHATTAFAALVAIGVMVPPARALLWVYAVLIALSRVVITAHHPSDVVAGAIVGAVGALWVRNWFAARRLGFLVGSDGAVRPLPGPSVRHILRALAFWRPRP
jgi:undecaprenyl-diphosphatase